MIFRQPLWISYEKLLLWGMLLSISLTVLVLGRLMPNHSAAILVLMFIGLYAVLIFLAHAHHRRKQAKLPPPIPNTSYHPSVSLVIPAHNEAQVIADTVRNLLQLDYKSYDLWVFDDRSTDGTDLVLETFVAEYPDQFHRVIRPPDALPGKAAVLNDALAHTTGEILVVFDADGRVAPDFLTRTLPYLSDPGVGAAQVRKRIINPHINLLTRCQYHEYLLDAHFQDARDVIRGAVELRGNGQLIKREALQSVDGWTEDTITDDLDLSTKLHIAGWDIRFILDTVVDEEGICRFRPLLRQRRRWAEGNLKRYLEHSPRMLTSPHMSRRAMLDMGAYIFKFLFPLWVAADMAIQVVNLFVGDWPRHLVSSMVILPLFGVFILSGAFSAIRQLDRPGILKSLWWALETAVFMLIVWVPVVMWITLKILITQDDAPLHWGKTEHLGTDAMVRRSRLERLKKLIPNRFATGLPKEKNER
jgi:1,2-diacylglycerol 3-beta-glucosyltransferase